jgi:hypothetical protein
MKPARQENTFWLILGEFYRQRSIFGVFHLHFQDPRVRGDPNTRSVFCHLLRSEFVRGYNIPLCSDAFTSWNSDPNEETKNLNNGEVTEATEYLHNHVIPHCAAALDRTKMDLIAGPFTSRSQIKVALIPFSVGNIHLHGINFRHLVNHRKFNLFLRVLFGNTVEIFMSKGFCWLFVSLEPSKID